MRRPSQFTMVSVFVLTVLVIPLASNIAGNAVPEPVRPYLWLAWPVAAAAAVTAAVLEVRRRHEAAALAYVGSEGEERLRHAAQELALTVHRQWSAEAQKRMLHRPQPLQVRWSSTGRPVTASAAAVLGEDAVGGRPVRLRLHGGIDDITQKYVQLPKRRLVLLGAPGAGKTVLAVLLTLGLVQHQREHGGPVPVLLSLSSWDPRAEHVHAWVVRRLTEDYPALVNSEVFGPQAASRLVTDGHVVPILDGLDEIPAELHTAAIDALDHIAPGSPWVITCRSEEYEAAVAAGGTVLTAAAVVELEPVGVREVTAFLSEGAAPDGGRWTPVLARMRACPDGPLARALSSPLMAAMARVIYSPPTSDPAELVDSVRFPDQDAVEGHLLDAFIPSAYAQHPPPPDARPGSEPIQYPPELVRRWFAFLAVRMNQHATRDLAWWQVHWIVPAAGRRLMGIVLELLTGIVAGLGVALGLGLSVGVLAGLAGGLSAGLVAMAPSRPGYVNLQIRGRQRLFGRKLVLGLAIGLMMGVGALCAFGLAAGLGVETGGGLESAAKAASTAGLSVGITFAAMMWLNAPADTIRSPSAQASLRDDRLVSGVRLVVESFGSGLLAGLTTGQHGFGLDVDVTWALTAGLGGGLAVGVAGRLTGRFQTGLAASTWGWYSLSRAWLSLRGRLPWRLMRFLNDAHERGVLRQAGAVYQFRHARLQDRLAAPAPVRDAPRHGGHRPARRP
ncbi:NACHT domain-containing protein [Streptomyces sp. G45]|uniref:NACHT domain-containing protein n=1 Tax=Streptomyces sp. G45 TaxID=3406627 RepID=UPI003C16F645